jgi:hypothetical protein
MHNLPVQFDEKKTFQAVFGDGTDFGVYASVKSVHASKYLLLIAGIAVAIIIALTS